MLFYSLCQNFHIGMHLDIYELIWFKLGMMVVTVEFYILTLA